MSLEQTVRDASEALRSERVTERRRNAEALKNLLGPASAVLSANQLRCSGFSWDDIFDNIHEFVLKECEKLETNRTFNTAHLLCSGLLYDTIVGANKGKAYIKSEKVIEASLQILQNPRLTKAFGDVYVNMLHKYVMPFDNYLRYISPQTWEDLLKSCATISCCEQSNVDALTNLRLILQIVQKGALYCHFVIPVRDITPKLKKHFSQPNQENKVQEVLLSIGIQLLEMLSTESRLTMCEFTEAVIPGVLKHYEQNADNKKKSLLFHFLELSVLLHHPRGRLQSNKGSLAYEWPVWNQHILSIMELVAVEGNFVERTMSEGKFKFHSDAGKGTLCKHFVKLAAVVFYQVIHRNYQSDVSAEYEESPAKRPRFHEVKTFHDIILKLREHPVPWISVITVYIRLYSTTISMMDNEILLSLLENYISSTNNKISWTDFGKSTCSILEKLAPGTSNDSNVLIMQTLWNLCVRYSSVDTPGHSAIHTIMQAMIDLDLVDKKNLPQLLKLYNEGAMMVTLDSVSTLNCLFRKYESKLKEHDLKLKYLAWLQQNKLDVSYEHVLEELYLHLITKENAFFIKNNSDESIPDWLYDVAFKNTEDNILASEFEIPLLKEKNPKRAEQIEQFSLQVCTVTKDRVDEYLCTNLRIKLDNLKVKKYISREYMDNLKTTIGYIHNLLKYNICSAPNSEVEDLWKVTCEGIDAVYACIVHCFNQSVEISDKILIVKLMVSLFSNDYHDFIEMRLRIGADEDFFRILHELINKDVNPVTVNADDVFAVDNDQDEDLKGKALELCALYCKRSDAQFREDVLELILDPKLYNFSAANDLKTAFRCIQILCHGTVNVKPIELLFRLMQTICKTQFRNTEASIQTLNILHTMLEDIGSLPTDTMKSNCIIMLRGYLHRCQTAYYPPCVTALVYKCIARIEELKHQHWNNTLKEMTQKGLESPIHSIRLYTCYNLNYIYASIGEKDLKVFLTNLLGIFEIEVSIESQSMLKDEAANRTSTVLHSVSALSLARPMWITKLIAALIEIAKNKSIDAKLVAKVLDLIITNVTGRPTEDYLRNNILPLLYHWLNMKITVSDISYWYFGYDSIEEFLKSHMSWLLPLEIFCSMEGKVGASSLLPMLTNTLSIEEDTIINNCFCNILVLSLPHFVHDKYEVAHPIWTEHNDFKLKGIKMLKSSMEWFGADKINTLYSNNLGSLVLLSTMLLVDPQHIQKKFHWSAPISPTESFNYSLQTFDLMLMYFGEIVGGCIMRNLCESMPLAMSNILLNLWSQIVSENVLEAKLIYLHRYVILFERIPFGTQLDSYICNFVCCTLLNTLRACHQNDKKKPSTGAVCKALHLTLLKVLPDKLQAIDKIIPQLMSTLIITKQENDCLELEELLSFLLNDMEYCLKDSIDLVDAATALTQGRMDSCLNSLSFADSLKNFIPKLTCYSLETLNNMKKFIKSHRPDLLVLCEKLKHSKGFSEHCQNSVIHQLINSLSSIAVNSKDLKCVLASCECLALIGPCDLKTLTTVTPESQEKVICVNPCQYLTVLALQTLSQNVFDEHPRVIQKITKALKCLLSFKEGKIALEQGDFHLNHLQPFISKRKNYGSVKCVIIDDNFKNIFKTQAMWIPGDNENYEEWLKRIMLNLTNVFHTEHNYLSELYEVCKLKLTLAEKLLPPLVGLLVSCSNESQIQVLSLQLTAFFQHFYEKTYYSTQDHNGVLAKHNSHTLMNKHRASVETMLRVVDFVRIQRLQYKKRREHGELYNYLRVDYQTVSWAACLTGHSIAAVLYGELWCLEQNEGAPPASPEATADLPRGEQVQNVFRKSYLAIGETDAVYGCGTGHLSNEGEKLNHIVRMGHINDALLMHDVAMSHPTTAQDMQVMSLHRGVISSFYKSGLYHIAVQYMKALPEDDYLDDVKFECYSNLGDWSLIVDKSSLEVKCDNSISKLESVIKAYQYSCLKDCLTIPSTVGYETRLRVPLENAKLSVANFLKKSNIENCQVIYNITSNLQLFQEIEEYYDIRCRNQPVVDLLTKWEVTKLMPFDNFQHIEPVLSQRSLILEHVAKFDSVLVDDVINLQLKYAELAMANNRQQLSSRLVAMAQRLRPGGMVSLMDGQVLWANGHKDIALHLIKSIINDINCTDRILRANALRQYGSWMMELRYESSRDILNKYLKGSLDTLGDGGHIETQLKVYLDLAKFADAEYKQVLAYTKSAIFENKVKCMQNMKGMASSIKELQSQQPISKDEQRAFHTNDKLSKFEEAEITSTYKEKKSFLDLAMKYYLLTLSKGDLSDLSIFRVISLWLDNPSNEFDNDEETLEQLLLSVPSRKYLPVLPQITPRITNDKTSFSSVLTHTIKRCALDHPHHTLPILFALSNSHKDQIFLKGTGQKKKKEEPRVVAARSTIQQLATADEVLQLMIHQMEQMNNALISLAYYKSGEPNQPGSRHAVPRSEPLAKLKDLDSVLVPIVTLPVSKDCLYNDITSVVSFSNIYTLVGGINAPKKMMCKGSDGIERTILLKGEDDLRQDAVMQQVFTIVNSFLEINQETSRRKLIIRTYKVVPLSRRSGVLEWCEGTDTVGNYLVGNTSSPGAHVRYRPKDITPNAARSMLSACGDKAKSKEHKLTVFRKILSQFKPVFHHFFTENFLAPVTWYERRLAYTKSVATSSMVGYMLGLGDRHVQNILIDKKTAEVVHIDFGIAFDQGRALPTPETVPFRLTQDIVAGFGSCGVDGVFRRSCEKTLKLLQENQETLLTILEVLLCDPLYTWTISAEQAKLKQNIPATPRDSTLCGAGDSGAAAGGGPAERALLAVSSKLCGTEGSAGGGMAVPGIVARLLQHATDQSKLAQLYVGWQPYI